MAAQPKASPFDAPMQQFDVAKQKAAQTANADLQVKRDALARRAAQLSGGPSGAFIKAEQGAINENQRNLADTNSQIDAAAAAERQRIAEIQQGQDFQSSERQAQQKFAAEQTAMDRALQAKQVALSEAGLTGKYNGQSTLAARQYSDAQTMAQNELKENVRTNMINSVLSAYNSKMPMEQMQKYLNDLNVDVDPKTGKIVVNSPSTAGFTQQDPKKKQQTGAYQTPTNGPTGYNSAADELAARQSAY